MEKGNFSMKSKTLNFLFFIYLSALASRGIFEIFISKEIAYFIQLLFCVVFYGCLLFAGKIEKRKFFSISLVLYIGFIFISILSGIATYLDKGFLSSWFYILINIFILFFVFFNIALKTSISYTINYKFIISLEIIILVLVGAYQQILVSEVLPGTTYVLGELIRPSSTTGSYLHYPLILVVLSSILLGLSIKPFNLKYFLIALCGVVGVFFSFSRSGNMILIFSFLLFF